MTICMLPDVPAVQKVLLLQAPIKLSKPMIAKAILSNTIVRSTNYGERMLRLTYNQETIAPLYITILILTVITTQTFMQQESHAKMAWLQMGLIRKLLQTKPTSTFSSSTPTDNSTGLPILGVLIWNK